MFIVWLATVHPTLPPPVRETTPAYPRWFWEMPSDKVAAFAVGYARRYARIETSFAYVRRQSVWQLVRSQQVKVDCSQELLNQFGQNRLLRLKESEQIDSSLAPTIVASMSIIDSAVVGDMVLALAAFPSHSNLNIRNERTSPSRRPQWLEVLPTEQSAIYVVGTSPLYYYEHHSWERAEAHARRQLASALTTHIRSTGEKTGQRMQVWSESQSSVTLRHAIVIKRWFDVSSRQCYVLCRMPIQ